MNHYAGKMYYNNGGRHFWFSRFLKIKGYSPTVFCSNSRHDSNGDYYWENVSLWEEHHDNNMKVPFVFVKARAYHGNGKKRVLNMVDFYRNVRKSAKQYAAVNGLPDVILASSVHPLTMLAGLKLAKKFKVPCICEVRDLWPEAIFSFGVVKEKSIIGRVLTAFEHHVYKKASALIFTKEGDIDHLKEENWTLEQGGDIDLKKCHYINNGICLTDYEKQLTEETYNDPDLDEDGVFNVVYTGTIRPVNNVGNILDCAKIVAAEKGCEKIRFLIFGDGSEKARLTERIEKENITNVKFKGRVERRYIPYILSKSSVNLLNYSQSEYNWSRGNSSNKLFEYMASGKPIISTVKMGYSIINRYKCGVELQECTPSCLAEEIMRFFNMPAEEYNEYGINARGGAKDFDFEKSTDKLIGIIESVKK